MPHEPRDSLRERLVDVGVELVLTEGAGSLGLREIARRAGVSHGAPRRYFPTHHSLLSAIARRGFAELESRFAEAAEGAAGPRDRLAAIARMYVRYALERRGMFELMFRHDLLDSGRHEPSGGPRLRESTLPLFASMTGLVARHQGGTDREAAVTAAALWANLHGVAQLWAWGSLGLALGDRQAESGDADDDALERLVTRVLDAHLGPAAS